MILLTTISGLTLLLFLVTLILGIKKKNKPLRVLSLFLLFAFAGLSSWTAFKFAKKSYKVVTEMLKPRTGDEIYNALFDKRETNCVKVLNYQDQIVPKMDDAIWLEFETCPKELKRILTKHKFSVSTFYKVEISNEGTLSRFDPATLGDTIMVYECTMEECKIWQTIWSNMDSTKAIVRDILY